MLSILIPVFNEEEAIEDTVTRVDQTLRDAGIDFEIVVIEDGSSDKTPSILAALNIPHMQVITHPINRGYGACMKTGIRRSNGDVIGITDADGTYPIEDFPKLLKEMQEKKADMVVGARTKDGAQIPLNRRPAKAVVNWLANILVGMRIPDLNSGFRIFTRDFAERFMHIYPQRFSFTITTTLAALTNDYIVTYTPIDYFKRKGTSSLSAGFNGIKNFLNFLGLIIRITTYFRPLRFFLFPAVLLVLFGIGIVIRTIYLDANVSDAGMLMLLTGVQIGLFGLLAEVVVRHRRS